MEIYFFKEMGPLFQTHVKFTILKLDYSSDNGMWFNKVKVPWHKKYSSKAW